jgi:hypothetical protein
MTKPMKRRWGRASLGGLALGGMLAGGLGLQNAGGSSHREAPLITEDPVVDATDTYAFVSPDDPDSVTLIANFIPLETPAGGPNFHRFGDDALYEINVDINADAIDDLRYQFRFSTKTMNPDTFLYNTGQVTSLDDPDLNVRQTYTVTELFADQSRTLAEGLMVPPANIGPRSTPDYEANLGSAGVHSIPTDFGDISVFAGPRKDPFFVDLGAVFDLAGLRPLNPAHLIPLEAADGVDTLAEYNTHSIAMKLPIAMIDSLKASYGVSDTNIGVYSSSYRRANRVFVNDGANPEHFGPWIEVSRLGMPLVNEVVVPLGSKDAFNTSFPINDSQFLPKVLDPEVANLIPVLYPGVEVPPAPRWDIAAIFLTGVEGLNMTPGGTPSEMIRLNYAVKPTVSDPNAQSRLGLLGGETDGFPNGRRLVDDVVDIELRALAGGTPFTPEFNIAPNNALTDGVDASNVPFLTTFPYVAPPLQGYETP